MGEIETRGMLTIYHRMVFRPLNGTYKEKVKLVVMERHHYVTPQQARNLMKDFRGQNPDVDVDGKWISDCEWM